MVNMHFVMMMIKMTELLPWKWTTVANVKITGIKTLFLGTKKNSTPLSHMQIISGPMAEPYKVRIGAIRSYLSKHSGCIHILPPNNSPHTSAWNELYILNLQVPKTISDAPLPLNTIYKTRCHWLLAAVAFGTHLSSNSSATRFKTLTFSTSEIASSYPALHPLGPLRFSTW